MVAIVEVAAEERERRQGESALRLSSASLQRRDPVQQVLDLDPLRLHLCRGNVDSAPEGLVQVPGLLGEQAAYIVHRSHRGRQAEICQRFVVVHARALSPQCSGIRLSGLLRDPVRAEPGQLDAQVPVETFHTS